MLPDTQCNTHTVTVQYTIFRAVANSSSRRLVYEYAERYTCAVVCVYVVYDLSIFGIERNTAALNTTYGDRRSTILGTSVFCKSSISGFRSEFSDKYAIDFCEK
jgi:hypothetical protein